MENVKLLEGLFNNKMLRILKFFLLHKDKQFYLQEIAQQSAVPIATVFRLVKKLTQLQVIQELRIKKLKLYQCVENEHTVFLETFLKEGKRIIDNFASFAVKIPGVEEIILYGQETEEKANVLLIGSSIDSQRVKKLCTEFREKYNYIVSALSLEKEQYEQMVNMGLYSSRKKSLVKK